jgi:hypothetical protein
MAWRITVVVAAGLLLMLGTVLVFLAIDRHSHSVSDTLRPFVITMAPVWVVALLAGGELISTGARKR